MQVCAVHFLDKADGTAAHELHQMKLVGLPVSLPSMGDAHAV